MTYARPADCACGHPAPLHAYGQRFGQTVRTYCNAATPNRCSCTCYTPAGTRPDRCPACGQEVPVA